jgi:hypothetical protein
MNYIRHLSAFYLKVLADPRLNTTHISLYHALFQFWNLNRFENPVSINRTQVLQFSKIGSYTTFYKCMYDLHDWGYIEYLPSHNPFKGSLVNLYNFDTSPPKNESLTCPKPEQALDQYLSNSGTSNVQAMYPSLNNTNITNKTLGVEKTQTQNLKSSVSTEKVKENEIQPGTKPKRKKVSQKKEKVIIPPSFDIVADFFRQENYPEKEARKFFFHFEANGWKVSGKSPMKSWTAAAHNWMLNTDKFNLAQKTNSLTLNNQKNYDEPL